MHEVLLTFGFGLVTAAILSLSAVAFTLEYAVTDVANLSHGEILTIGAYAAYLVHQLTGSLLLAALAAAASDGIVALAMHTLVIDRFVRRGVGTMSTFIATLGMSFVIQNVLVIIFGAGKSTAIDLISGFKLADSGTIFFEGSAIQGLPPHRISRLGLIRTFQTPREWPGLTVLENVLLARWDPERESLWRSLVGPKLAHLSTSKSEIGNAREILVELGLSKLSNERAGNLSGGQKRLVEFARR